MLNKSFIATFLWISYRIDRKYIFNCVSFAKSDNEEES